MMGLGGQSATLTSFEVHHLVARPASISLAMMCENLLTALAQHVQSNSKAAVGGFRARDRLKKKVHRRSTFQGGQLGGDVSQATTLRWNCIVFYQSAQSSKNRAHRLDRVCGWIDANH